ncbi:AraC family transcriptional regulator ligand-binding domain-containing protein [Pseudomonas sp. BNK-15]|uniref:AraC family transcriptional regulator n=1 Tax=Pseudomonas sp. BNK-15 TaxID=3376152 RepID=UPI0039BFE722
MLTISASFVDTLVRSLIGSGLSDLPVGQLVPECNGLYRIKDLYRFLGAAHDLGVSPDFGLQVYSYVHPAMLEKLGHAVIACPTLEYALCCLARFHHLNTNGSILNVEYSGGLITLVGVEVGDPAPRAFIDAGLAFIIGIVRWLSPGFGISPVKVELTYDKPKNTKPLREVCGCAPDFLASRNSVSFSVKAARLPLPMGSEPLWRLHLAQLDQVSKVKLKVSEVLALEVRKRLVLGGSTTLADVAFSLKMSPRSLQGALNSEGCSYTTIADSSRAVLVSELLQDSDRPLKDIAQLTGFADHSSFHKACIRWFDVSPGAYRRGLQR